MAGPGARGDRRVPGHSQRDRRAAMQASGVIQFWKFLAAAREADQVDDRGGQGVQPRGAGRASPARRRQDRAAWSASSAARTCTATCRSGASAIPRGLGDQGRPVRGLGDGPQAEGRRLRARRRPEARHRQVAARSSARVDDARRRHLPRRRMHVALAPSRRRRPPTSSRRRRRRSGPSCRRSSCSRCRSTASARCPRNARFAVQFSKDMDEDELQGPRGAALRRADRVPGDRDFDGVRLALRRRPPRADGRSRRRPAAGPRGRAAAAAGDRRHRRPRRWLPRPGRRKAASVVDVLRYRDRAAEPSAASCFSSSRSFARQASRLREHVAAIALRRCRSRAAQRRVRTAPGSRPPGGRRSWRPSARRRPSPPGSPAASGPSRAARRSPPAESRRAARRSRAAACAPPPRRPGAPTPPAPATMTLTPRRSAVAREARPPARGCGAPRARGCRRRPRSSRARLRALGHHREVAVAAHQDRDAAAVAAGSSRCLLASRAGARAPAGRCPCGSACPRRRPCRRAS